MITKYSRVFSRKNSITGIVSFVLLSTGISLFYSSLDTTRQNYFLSKVVVWNYFKTYEDSYAGKMNADLEHIPAFDFSEDYYENANLRVIFWKKSFSLFKDHPFTGVGAGNWRIAIPAYKDPPNPEHTARNFTYSQPHNEWISIVSELGIPGFILAILIFLVPVAIILYRLLFTPFKPPVSVLFYTSFLIGFYLFSCFDFPMKRVEHNVMLFSIFAFLFQKAPLKTLPVRASRIFSSKIFSRTVILLLLFTICLSLLRFQGGIFYTENVQE